MQFLKNPNINFIKYRKPAFLVSVVLVALSIAFFFLRSPQWGIDFTGGSLYHLKFKEAPETADLRAALESGGITGSSIQKFRQSGIVIVRVRNSETDSEEAVTAAINTKLPDSEFEIIRSEMVGPVVGSYIKEKAVKAFVFAFAGMIIYVAWRFRGGIWGLAAVIALVHDVIITFGILNYSGITIDLPVVAALLTLAGYSINDSIVVYDRIRENIKLHYKKPLGEIINTSINSTLSRTVITSGTTLFVVLALFFKGGEVLHGFSTALLAGIIIGTYSSIFIAAPLVYVWQSKDRK